MNINNEKSNSQILCKKNSASQILSPIVLSSSTGIKLLDRTNFCLPFKFTAMNADMYISTHVDIIIL